MATQLTNISKYKSLENFILKSEKNDYSINDAFADINNISFADDPFLIVPYLKKRFSKNDIDVIMSQGRTNVAPLIYATLQSCPATSSSVERCFSQMKHLLRSDRPFSGENIAHYLSLVKKC